jgi:3-oxoacyl-[acyl-carrier protein] reductase
LSGQLEALVAVVSGAAHGQGIGRAIADRFVDEGAVVVVADLISAVGFAELDAAYHPQACDVTDASAVAAMMHHVVDQFDRVDILVNNAGVARGAPDFMQNSAEDWALSLDVNLMGTVNMCRAALAHMGNGSAIVNVASLAGLGAIEGIPACYTASKFAVVGLTKQLAQELAPRRIRCNALCPGSIHTQMHEQTLALVAQEHDVDLHTAQQMEDASIPMGFTAPPSTVGDAAVFLASPAAGYITGVTLPVAGGMAPGL